MKSFYCILFFNVAVFFFAVPLMAGERVESWTATHYQEQIAAREAEAQKNEGHHVALADAYFFLALITPHRETFNFLAKARAHLLQAQKLNPGSASIYSHLARVDGQVALAKGGKEKVRMAYQIRQNAEIALQMNPDEPLANLVLGVWYYELAGVSSLERFFGNLFYGKIPEGDYNTALSYLEKAVRLEPQTIYFRLAFAKTLLQLNLRSAARKQLEEALQLPLSEAVDRQNKAEARKILETL